jgi:hypothetical protein
MNWVLLIGAVWLAVAALVGVLIGRGIRLADHKEEESAAAEAAAPNFVVDPDAPAVVERPATPVPDAAAEADATPESTTSDRGRHPIPTARPPAVRAPVRPSERTPSPRDPGLF